MQNEESKKVGQSPIKPEALANGHGKFPYVIVRLMATVYLQVPIIFAKDDRKGANAIIIYADENAIEDKTKFLIETVSEYKVNLEAKRNRPHKLCLVLDEHTAYFYDGDQIRFNESIPSGGALMNWKQEIIAMNVDHFVSHETTNNSREATE